MNQVVESVESWGQQLNNLHKAVAMPSCADREPAILAAFMSLAALVRSGAGDAQQFAQLLERHLPGERPQWREVIQDEDFTAELARGEKNLITTTLQGCIDKRDWARVQRFACCWLAAVDSPLPESDALALMRFVVTHVAVYDHDTAKELFTKIADRYPLIAQLQQDDREVKIAFAVGKAMSSLSLAARCYLCELMHSYSGQSHVGLGLPTTAEQQEITQYIKKLPANHVVSILLRKRFPHEFGHIKKNTNHIIALTLFVLSTTGVTVLWVVNAWPPAMGVAIVGAIGFGLWRKTLPAKKNKESV